MELTHNRIDLAACEAAGHKPYDVISRKAGETWLVSNDAIKMDAPIRWTRYGKDEQLLVPLVPYIVRPEPDLAMGYLFQLGIRAAHDLQQRVQRVHIASGYPVNDIAHVEDFGRGWQYHVGFAILLG